ncbi:MAG: alpha,2-mannosidase [Fibrobacteres bacterium]|nr:alpha,2-mannosidase [Fibrobacterota bacterium]
MGFRPRELFPWPKAFCLAMVSCLVPAGPCRAALVDYVNPLRGTNAGGAYSYGATVPAVSMPFGFTFYTPMTDIASGWKYSYQAASIQGFGVSHVASPWIGDWGAMQIMATKGGASLAPADRASKFSHDEERSGPDYYRVNLQTYGVTVEITPTMHASVWRFAFPAGADNHILFDTPNDKSGSIAVDKASGSVSGYVDDTKRLYVYAKVDRPITAFDIPAGQGVCAWMRFASAGADTVTMRLGTSFISVEQAKANLEREVGSKSFDDVRAEASGTWNKLLGSIEIEGATEDQKMVFYSCFYRACLYPNAMWENVNGNPRYSRPTNAEVRDGYMYVNNGFWDTYRTAWPFYTLLMPKQTGRMLQGFLNHYRDDGMVPQWSAPWDHRAMLGTSSDAVFADAFVKGVRGFDSALAYEAMLKNAMGSFDFGGRNGNKRAPFLGYVPNDLVGAAAAWHLEDCIADFGISQMAGALGKEGDREYFLNRSLNYAKIFSPEVGFFRGRNLDGTWRTSDADFHPNEWGHEFVEGGPWQYRALAIQDGQGLANLFGGRANLGKRIDEVFEAPPEWLVGSYGGVIHEMRETFDSRTGQYGHTNEQTFSMIYMYNYAGMPWKTQQRARDVMDRIYATGIGDGKGYLGDEDNGAMSTWYLFSALGFFPACPARPEYAIGSPLFTKAVIHLENGKDFTINAPGNGAANRYVQSATLNGASYPKNFLRHADIIAGGTLTLNMGGTPSTWGGGADDVPGSVSPVNSVPVGLQDLARGGTVTASGENGAVESAAMAFDDNSATKWRSTNGPWWIQYRLPGTAGGAVGLYTLTSGNDAAQSDPKEWTLRGSDDGAAWTVLDGRSNETFRLRNYTRAFKVENPRAFKQYRFDFKAVNGGAYLHLDEIELIQQNGLMGTVSNRQPVQAEIKRPSVTVRLVHGRFAIPAGMRQRTSFVTVYSLHGKKVHAGSHRDRVLDLQRDFHLPPGTYLVRIE